MVEDRDGDGADVVEAHGRAAVEERDGARGLGHRDRGARRGAVADVFADFLGRGRGVGVRGGDEARDPGGDGARQDDARDGVEAEPQRFGGHPPLGARRLAVAARGEDVGHRLGVEVSNEHAEEEAVELRFGERVGALELDRVLAREDEERVGQRARRAEERDGALLHRLEHRGLRLRGGAVDLVGEEDVAEDRAGLEDHLAAAVRGGLEDVRAEDVAGHEVGRELHALEVELQDVAHGLHERGLAEAGQALQQDVPAREDAGEDEPVQLVAAEQDAVQFRERPREGVAGGGDLLRGRQRRLGGVCRGVVRVHGRSGG